MVQTISRKRLNKCPRGNRRVLGLGSASIRGCNGENGKRYCKINVRESAKVREEVIIPPERREGEEVSLWDALN